MYPVDKKAITDWVRYANHQNVYVPESIDVTCPKCRRSPVNFAIRNWDLRTDCDYAKARCPACSTEIELWLLNRPSASDAATTARSTLYMLPEPPFYKPFDPAIAEVSPTFVEVYGQAAKAEALGLAQLVGVGYRKALEFLIKDYLCQRRPTDAEAIKKARLGPCIQKYVDDHRIKEIGRRAVWLGNDETHYVRQWLDRDLDDLKALLTLTIYWIESDLISDRFIAEMPDPKGS